LHALHSACIVRGLFVPQTKEMVKEADTQLPIHDLIRSRWSPRAFDDTPISQQDVNTILTAASWSFSAMNRQPWRYIYAHKKDTVAFEKLLSCLLPLNQKWAKNAPLLMIGIAETEIEGKPYPIALHDLGAANATMVLEAQHLSIYSHLMGGFNKEATIKEYNLPKNFEPVVIIAFGYLGDEEKVQQLDEVNRGREKAARSRRDISQFAFENGFQNQA